MGLVGFDRGLSSFWAMRLRCASLQTAASALSSMQLGSSGAKEYRKACLIKLLLPHLENIAVLVCFGLPPNVVSLVRRAACLVPQWGVCGCLKLGGSLISHRFSSGTRTHTHTHACTHTCGHVLLRTNHQTMQQHTPTRIRRQDGEYPAVQIPGTVTFLKEAEPSGARSSLTNPPEVSFSFQLQKVF